MMSSLTQQPPSLLPLDSDALEKNADAVVVVSSEQSLSEQPSLSQLSNGYSSDSSSSSAMMMMIMAPASSPSSATETTTTISLEDGNKSNSEKDESRLVKEEQVDAASQQLIPQQQQQPPSSLSQQPTLCRVAADESDDSAFTKMMIPTASTCTTKTNCDDCTKDDTVNNNNGAFVESKVDEEKSTVDAVLHARARLAIDQLDKDEMSLLASMDMLGASFYHHQELEESSTVIMEETKQDTRPVIESLSSLPSTLHQQQQDDGDINNLINLDSIYENENKAIEKKKRHKKQRSRHGQVNTSPPLSEDYYDDDELKKQLCHAKKEIVLFQLREVSLRKELNATKTELVSLQDKMHVMIRLASVVMIAVMVESFKIIIRGAYEKAMCS